MNDQLQAFLKKPSHALLISGRAEDTAAAAEAAIDHLLGDDRTYTRTIAPEKDSIGIEQIRDLIAFFRLKVPGRAAIRRAAMIQQAEKMGAEAQNALLKLLEEPPTDSVLILTSEQPRKLLATIRSRVQQIHVNGTAGAPDGEAVQLVKQVLSGTSYDRLLLVDGLAKQKDTLPLFVDTLVTVAEASLVAAAGKKAPTIGRWQTVLQAAHTAQDALDKSGNAKLVLTELMLAL